MKLHTFLYRSGKGWSIDTFPQADSPQTLVLIFGAPSFAARWEVVAPLLAAYPQAHIIGCSTSGEIHGEEIFDESLSVAVLHFAHTGLRSASAQIEDASQSFAAGQRLASELLAPDLRGIFVLSDGLNVNGSALVRGLTAALPEGVVVTGGLAGDGDRFQSTWVVQGRRPAAGWVCAVGLYGEHVRLGHGSRGGWDIFGPERLVTRSEGNVLYELDGRPALALYKDYLGERAADLPASALLFPLSLRPDSADEEPVVRTVLSIDEAKQSMTFAGDIPTGFLARLMRANFERLVDGAADAGLRTVHSAPLDGPVLSIAISCVGRRLVLGERSEEEVEAALESLPEGCQQVGFYSYGEISPLASGDCSLHNQTMTLTAISEAA